MEMLPCLSHDRYERYSQKRGWKFEVVDITESDLKGYKVPVPFSVECQIDPFMSPTFRECKLILGSYGLLPIGSCGV